MRWRPPGGEGFQGLELCIGLDGEIVHQDPPIRLPENRRIDRAFRRGCADAGRGNHLALNPTSNDKAVRRASIDAHKAALERAAWLGCQAMLYIPGVVKSPISAGHRSVRSRDGPRPRSREGTARDGRKSRRRPLH